MATRRIEVIIGGDASKAQKAFRDVEQAAGSSQPKVEGFGKEFLKLGAAFGLGAGAAETAVEVLKGLGEMVVEYNKKIQDASATIVGVTKNQDALAQAFAFADQEVKAGRAAFSDTVAAIADLTPVAKRAGLDVTELYRTVQLLSTLNSGPEGGVGGAVIAINEALAGQFTSLEKRFNLPLASINALKAQGVPTLQLINTVLAQEGVTFDLVNAKSKTYGNQMAIAKDEVARLAAEVGKPIFDALADGLEKTNKQLTSDAWAKYAAQYQQFVKLLIESLTSWKALSGVTEEVGIQIERTLQGWVQGFLTASEFVGQAIGKLLHIPDAQLAGAKDNNPLQKVFDAWVASTNADQAKLDQWAKTNFADPIAAAAQGNTPGSSTIAPAAMQGYGRAVVENFLRGASSVQVGQLGDLAKLIPDTAKPGTDDYKAALSDLAQALQEVAQTGQISETTLYRLNTVFGAGTGEVAAQVVAYGQLAVAQQNAADAAQALADANYNLEQVQNRAKGDLAGYEAAVTSAQQAATDNAAAAQEAVDGLTQTLDGLRAAADDAARASAATVEGLQSQLDGLQNTASQHQAANQAAIGQAQAALSAASQQRQNDQALLNAALAGELEYEEQILDGLTDEQRAIAAKWQAEIDGQRRAKEGANQKVTDLSRAAHKEDLDYLTKIDAARASGNEKEARRLERELAARQKQRQAATQLAQAQAAVANDDFDAAQERIKKEGQAQEVKDTQAERAAQANLDRVQAAAKAQADADAAAIKGKQDQIKAVQDAAKAEADRYAAQERGIQREITLTQQAAKEQKRKDDDAIAAARAQLLARQTYWNLETTGAQAAVNLTGGLATGWERAEKAAQDLLTHLKDIAQILKDNPAISNPQPTAKPGTQTSPYDETPPYVPPGTGTATPPAAPSNLPQLLEGRPGFPPPSGYHTETDTTGTFWYVPNGHTLKDYGKTPASSAPGDSTLNSAKAGIGGPGLQFQRAAGFGGGAGGGAAGGSTINIHLPNVTSLGDPAQRATMWRQIEREWDDVERGGHVKRDTGA